jgi:hypothetical protein
MKFDAPCECGRHLTVTAGDAGSTFRCECGLAVQIPDLRSLRESVPPTSPEPLRKPTDWAATLRIVGPILVVMAFVLQCSLRPLPGMSGDQIVTTIIMGMYGGIALSFIGIFIWALGKGCRWAYGLLLAFLGPIGVIVLLISPTRER